MHKLQKAAVMAVVVGSFGFLGAGTAYADGGRGGTELDIRQSASCRSHDANVDVLGEVGLLNGVLGNALGGEGAPGAQSSRVGSTMGCSNTVGSLGEKRGGEDKGRGSEGREGKEGREDGGDGV